MDLGHFDQWELNADIKTSLSKKRRPSDEFGCGIAAQVGQANVKRAHSHHKSSPNVNSEKKQCVTKKPAQNNENKTQSIKKASNKRTSTLLPDIGKPVTSSKKFKIVALWVNKHMKNANQENDSLSSDSRCLERRKSTESGDKQITVPETNNKNYMKINQDRYKSRVSENIGGEKKRKLSNDISTCHQTNTFNEKQNSSQGQKNCKKEEKNSTEKQKNNIKTDSSEQKNNIKTDSSDSEIVFTKRKKSLVVSESESISKLQKNKKPQKSRKTRLNSYSLSEHLYDNVPSPCIQVASDSDDVCARMDCSMKDNGGRKNSISTENGVENLRKVKNQSDIAEQSPHIESSTRKFKTNKIRPVGFSKEVFKVNASTQVTPSIDNLKAYVLELEDSLTIPPVHYTCNLSSTESILRIETVVNDARGNDLTDFIKNLVKNFKKKELIILDKLNCFMTLNSRFQIFNTGIMEYLEVLSWDPHGVDNREADQVRIVNLINKSAYKDSQTVPSSHYESIPEIVVTRLFEK